ncbi:MAG: phosphatidylglycerol:prolipoprotein diacylglycerol transferase [Bradymonadia bacterium]|jgi:phosphatidylglycerol:prolipoprotein diacylglycerol transferase
MIPFWYPGAIDLPFGPDWLQFHIFGILVGIGVVLGSWIAQRRAEETGLNGRVAADLGLWIVMVAFFFAHQVSLFAYFPERVFGVDCAAATQCMIDGTQYVCGNNGRCDNGSWTHVFQIWNGISSFGGFLGAFIAVVTFFRFKKIVIIPGFFELAGGKGRPAMKYVDTIALGFIIGWLFGRLGCFSAHDHVGVLSDSFLAVNFPNDWRGGVPNSADFGAAGFTPRMDLGFMEVLYCIPAAAVMFFWARKQKGLRPGWFAAFMMLPYAPYRFYLDTLRATDISGADKRYFTGLFETGLTPGQIGAIALFCIGIVIFVIGGRLKRDEAYMAFNDGDTPPGEVPPAPKAPAAESGSDQAAEASGDSDGDADGSEDAEK